MSRVSAVDYANEVHQLLVSISRHLYLSEGGVLKYREEPMKVDLTNLHRLRKEHLVHYVLRDLFSGNFVFAVATTRKMFPLLDFLHYGWKEEKKENHFWGLPRRISVPKRLSSPELLAGLQRLEVEPFHPTSGFTSGVRIIRSLEDNLCYYILGCSALHFLDTIERYKGLVYEHMLGGDGGDNRIDRWSSNLSPGHPRKVPEYDRFRSIFPVADPGRPGLLLAGLRTDQCKIKWHRPGLLDSPLEDKKFSPVQLARARKLLSHVYLSRYRDTALYRAYEVLALSPYCTDAYNLLADKSRYLEEKIALYRRAVRAGELSLGELFFKQNEGHFWTVPESRPYMRALYGLAVALWGKGERSEAIALYQKLLRLDHDDLLGVRDRLSFCLLAEERYQEMGKLSLDPEGYSCTMLYNLALGCYCSGAAGADGVLNLALRANKHVPAYLLGEEKLPHRLPERYSPGSKEEAAIYAAEAAATWQKASGPLDWLRKNCPAGTGKGEHSILMADPNIIQILQDFLAEQAVRLNKRTLSKYRTALELLQACLDNYGPQLLDEAEARMLERYLGNDEGRREGSLCHLFGPDKILGIISEFLGYFMIRKVSCGKDQLRVTGTSLKKLAGWLAEKNYISPGGAARMAASAIQASRDLPAAGELSTALSGLVSNSPLAEGDEMMEDLFEVVKIEPGRLYLQPGVGEPVVIDVPRKISALGQTGWLLNLLLVKTEGGWRIVKTGGVYPPL